MGKFSKNILFIAILSIPIGLTKESSKTVLDKKPFHKINRISKYGIYTQVLGEIIPTTSFITATIKIDLKHFQKAYELVNQNIQLYSRFLYKGNNNYFYRIVKDIGGFRSLSNYTRERVTELINDDTKYMSIAVNNGLGTVTKENLGKYIGFNSSAIPNRQLLTEELRKFEVQTLHLALDLVNATDRRLELAYWESYLRFESLSLTLGTRTNISRESRQKRLQSFLGLAYTSDLEKIWDVVNAGEAHALNILGNVTDQISDNRLALFNLNRQVADLQHISDKVLYGIEDLARAEELEQAQALRNIIILKIESYRTEIITSLDHLTMKIKDIWKEVELAKQGKVTPLLIGPIQMEKLHKKFNLDIKQSMRLVSPRSSSDMLDFYELLQAEVVHYQKQTTAILIRIPLIKKELKFTLIRLHSLFLPISTSSKIQTKIKVPKEEFIGIGYKKEKMIMFNEEDLKSCRNYKRTWYCSLNIMKIVSGKMKTCITKLLDESIVAKIEECETKTISNRNFTRISNLYDNHYIYELPANKSMEITCEEKKGSKMKKETSRKFNLKRVGVFTLQSHCKAVIGNIIIPRRGTDIRYNFTTNSYEDTFWYSIKDVDLITTPMGSMLDNQTTVNRTLLGEMRKDLIKDMKDNKNNVKFLQQSGLKLKIIQRYIQLAKEEYNRNKKWFNMNKPSSWEFANSIVTILIVITVIIIVFKILLKHKRTKKQHLNNTYDIMLDNVRKE